MPKSPELAYYTGGISDQKDLFRHFRNKTNPGQPKPEKPFTDFRRKAVAATAVSALGAAGILGVGISTFKKFDAPDQTRPQATTLISQAEAPPQPPPAITPAIVKAMIPDAPQENIDKYYPLIIAAMNEQGLGDVHMLAYAAATVGVETAETFAPIEEFNGRAQARRLGYGGGENFYGRGFLQLTHDTNYLEIGQILGMDDELVENPQLALDPVISTKILAIYLKQHEDELRNALSRSDLTAARKIVNGGTNGLSEFSAAYTTGLSLSENS